MTFEQAECCNFAGMNLKTNILFLIPFLFLATLVYGQEFTQTVRGTVQAEETQLFLSDIAVTLSNGGNSYEVKTDENGNFSFSEIAVGRIDLRFAGERFETVKLDNLLLTSGKELVLEVKMNLARRELKTVEVNQGGTEIVGKPINRMAAVSSYVIRIEETKKFAGSWDDPMRVVTNYPGVVQLNSGFNSFTVRGNAPVGMLYRLEGIPIHNPNHFAAIGSTGGFVTQFSTQLLTTSEFFSGAFPAEFGNATTAVFDFKFRKGNDERYEHSAGINVFGVDVATEGPFKKGSKATYLINYRYSSLGILARSLNFASIVPSYQDLSFNLNFPTKKAGTFKLFGIGGLSNLTISANRDTANWDGTENRTERNLGSNSGALGLSHYLSTSNKGYWHTVLAASTGEYYDNAEYLENDLTLAPREIAEATDTRLTFTTDYNYRFNRRHSNKTGIIITHIDHSFKSAQYTRFTDQLDTFGITNGASQTYQAFTQSNFDLTDKMKLIAGVHYLQFAYNNKFAIEPRVGLRYNIGTRSLLALGYGLHSRVEDLSIYFYQGQDDEGNTITPNRDLGLLQSHQGVVRFAHMFTKNLKFTAETYYQFLDNVPADPNGAFSVQNLLWRFPTMELDNVGQGRNYGLELSLQRFTKNGFYFLITGALYNSEYRGGDGVWRNTEFNQNFSYNLLAGKEYELKPKENKKRFLSLNANLRHSGGTWQNRVDTVQSALFGWTQYDFDNPYSERQPDLVNFDFTLSLKNIRKKMTGEFSVQIKNLFNNRTVISQEWDDEAGEIKLIKDYGVIPVIGYKVWF